MACMRGLLCLLLLGSLAAAQEATLVVGTKEAPPLAMRDADGGWSGISIELWKAVAADAGVAYRFEERSLKGLLQGVGDGSLHAAIAALSITPEREEKLDFSHPYFDAGLAIAAAKRPAGVLGFLAKLFTGAFLGVLAGLFLLLFAIGMVVWLFERRRNPEQFGGGLLHGLGEGIWWSAVTMTTVGYGDRAPITRGGRLIALMWMFASVILLSTFTAAIASSVTVAHFESEIGGPADLPGKRVAAVSESTGAEYLGSLGVLATYYTSAADAVAAVARGEQDAVVHDGPVLRYLVRGQYSDRVEVLPGYLVPEDYAIALPEGSPYLERINRAIARVRKSAAWRAVLQRYLGRDS